MLEGRTPTSSEAEREGAFARLASYRDGAIFAGKFAGTSARERQNLLVTAIILWNTRYLERAVTALRQIENVPSHLLAHLSPLGWEHVNLTGDYVWDVQQRASENPGGLRALRQPPEVVRKAA